MKTILFAFFLCMLGTAAFAEDTIDGVWTMYNDDKVRIAPCDTSHCISGISGKFAGKELGKLTRSEPSRTGLIFDETFFDAVYKGAIIDIDSSERLEIKALLSGSDLNIRVIEPRQDKLIIWMKE